jgi:RecA-family ATPase
VLAATRAAAGHLGERWNWRREESAIRQMCETWLTKHPDVKAHADEAEKAEPKKSAPHWHGDIDLSEGRASLAQDLLPQTGKGLMSGQWGVFKTFVALDLAAALMAGAAFIDFLIIRCGGVLFIAAEGGAEIPVRLQAVLENKYPQSERAPFAWTNASPQLLGRKSISELVTPTQEAAARMQSEFGLPLALIVIDTIVATAGYSKIGEESDAAVGQAIMNVLEQLGQLSGALVLGIDHFGKSAETGTRGTWPRQAPPTWY